MGNSVWNQIYTPEELAERMQVLMKREEDLLKLVEGWEKWEKLNKDGIWTSKDEIYRILCERTKELKEKLLEVDK